MEPCLQESASVPILTKINPIHNFPPYLPKIQSDIILSSTPRFLK
jgi:hypothetical protein